MRQRWILRRSDWVAGLVFALGLGRTAYSLRGAELHRLDRVDIVLLMPGLILWGVALAIWHIGRRRERQALQEQEETQRRGYASKMLMPAGDQAATVIVRAATMLVVLGGLLGIGIAVAGHMGYIWSSQQVFVVTMGAVIVMLGGSFLMGIRTRRRLREQNRKYAEPWCPLCEYVLYGAEGRRCPECGMLFNLDEVNTNMAYLDEQGRLQPKSDRTA